MVQLQLLNGSRSGTVFKTNRFPTRVGRDASSEVYLDDAGVWQRHFQIHWRPEGLILEAEQDALLSVNDTPVKTAPLRNGDVITIGSLKMRFNFAPVRQTSLVLREWGTWIALGLLCLGQVALVYVLLQ